jgi:hypothetical protein
VMDDRDHGRYRSRTPSLIRYPSPSPVPSLPPVVVMDDRRSSDYDRRQYRSRARPRSRTPPLIQYHERAPAPQPPVVIMDDHRSQDYDRPYRSRARTPPPIIYAAPPPRSPPPTLIQDYDRRRYRSRARSPRSPPIIMGPASQPMVVVADGRRSPDYNRTYRSRSRSPILPFDPSTERRSTPARHNASQPDPEGTARRKLKKQTNLRRK